MRRQILGISLLVVLLSLTLLPPFFSSSIGAPAVVNTGPPTPGPNDLNATTPLIVHEDWTPANPTGNTSLLDVVVLFVNASDIGECIDGHLTAHTFSVIFDVNESLVFTDDLAYISGTGWAVLDYSLLQWNLKPETYKVTCFFERDTGTEIWNTTTDPSASFAYNPRLTISTPDYTYIADTSDTIDVFVSSISSTIWGVLTEANTTLRFQNSTGYTDRFEDALTYNATSMYWETYELNISILIPGESYKIRCEATYNLVQPFHEGISPTSDAFVFKGPYLRVAQPEIVYIGRTSQTLNMTVAWVWHSIFGYLNTSEVTLSNFSIFLSSESGGALVNGTLDWNSTGAFWYFTGFNVSFYVDQGILTIGDSYKVSAFFIAPPKSGRPSVQNFSPFSELFIIDFTPPSINNTFINPSEPEDYQWVIVTGEISDDALIDTVILSYFNGTQWINVTMLGSPGKLANFSASIPPFPEREVVEYHIYVNDTQNNWDNATVQYTVADTLPVISFISYRPRNPSDVDLVTINVTVTDGTGVDSVDIRWTYDGTSWHTLTMQHLVDDIYQVTLPRYPQTLMGHEFRSVVFIIEAADVYDNIRESANQAYMVQGSLPSVDPATTLLIIAIIGIAGVALILLYKIYEQY